MVSIFFMVRFEDNIIRCTITHDLIQLNELDSLNFCNGEYTT